MNSEASRKWEGWRREVFVQGMSSDSFHNPRGDDPGDDISLATLGREGKRSWWRTGGGGDSFRISKERVRGGEVRGSESLKEGRIAVVGMKEKDAS